MIAWLLWSGCAAVAPRGVPEGPISAVAEDRSAEGALWLQGFAVRWEARPHRLRTLGFAAEGTAAPGAELEGALRATARGGSWSDGRLASDQPRLAVRYAAARSGDLVVRSGTTRLVVQGGRGGQRALGSVPVHVPWPEGVPAVAWLTSFAFDTSPSHEDGFTPRRLEVSLGAPAVVGDGVEVVVAGELDAAPVPDRRQQLRSWTATIDVGWVVVGAPGGRVHRLDVQRDLEESVDPNDVPGRREPLRVPIHVDLAGLGAPVAGLSSFGIGVEEGPIAGRYLRALAVGVEDERVDLARAAFDAAVALQFSNGGTIPRKVRVDARATVSVLEPAGPVEVRRGRWAPEGEGFERAVRYPSLEPL